MKRTMILILSLLICISNVGSTKASDEIWGKIEKVDVKELEIHGTNSNVGEFVIWIDKDTVIKREGTVISLDDVKNNEQLTATVETIVDNKYLGVTINVKKYLEVCTEINGLTQSIDSNEKTILVWNHVIGSFKVEVAENALITRDGETAKIEDVKTGDMTWFTAKRIDNCLYTATKIDARGFPQ